jgi:stage V sporulation protein SpoVS
LKVAGSGDAGKIAGAIANKIRDGERVALEGIGPIAVNTAVKSIVHARKYLIDDGMDLGFRPEFAKFEIEGEEKVGMHFALFASQT